MKKRRVFYVVLLTVVMISLALTGCGGKNEPSPTPSGTPKAIEKLDENEIYSLLVEYDFEAYSAQGVGIWYGTLDDTGRVNMAKKLVELFAKLNVDMTSTTGNELAQKMNDYYDKDSSLSIWQTACIVMKHDGSDCEKIWADHNENEIYSLLVEYDFEAYSAQGVGIWYGTLDDTGRVNMAKKLVELFAKLNVDMTSTTDNELAQKMNDYYDKDSSLSIWQTACIVMKHDGSDCEKIWADHKTANNIQPSSGATVIYGDLYTIDGDVTNVRLLFHDEHRVALSDASGVGNGTYKVEGSKLILTFPDSNYTDFELKIIDSDTLLDENNDTNYIRIDTQEQEDYTSSIDDENTLLVEDGKYSLSGDTNGEYIYFEPNLSFYIYGGATPIYGTYSVDGSRVIIDLDGTEEIMEIIDKKTLMSSEGNIFHLVVE